MSELQLLRPDHDQAVLAFERANRDFFATMITDRGDAYFEHFAERHNEELADQEAGLAAYHVLVGEDSRLLGRFNLRFPAPGTAVLGYRVARHAGGRGVATATVRDVCQLAVTRYGVHSVVAATADANVASQRVLMKSGFVPVGPAEPIEVGGKRGTRYRLEVAAGPGPGGRANYR